MDTVLVTTPKRNEALFADMNYTQGFVIMYKNTSMINAGFPSPNVSVHCFNGTVTPLFTEIRGSCLQRARSCNAEALPHESFIVNNFVHRNGGCLHTMFYSNAEALMRLGPTCIAKMIMKQQV